MGSTTGGTGGLDNGELFGPDETFSEKLSDNRPLDTPAILHAMAKSAPAQTDAKARLIASYISKFQLVTGGGLYIDGFAGPQKREFEDAWTARRVLEIEPPRIRTFWLCDNDPSGIEALRRLKKVHHRNPKSRRVIVYEGDFNQSVERIIASDRIKRRSAVFALIDQRNTECHWATVRRLAEHKGRTRIELLYFLGVAWLHRSLTQSKRRERVDEIDRWWGGPGWKNLVGQTQVELSLTVARRFQTELGYPSAVAWPIFMKEGSKRKAFALIHASDHPEAPKLMRRAYMEIYGRRAGSPTDAQRAFKGFLKDD